MLATAICLLDEYDADQTKKLFFEISYEIIARYSVATSDYRPLYDFSVNYGFFPIVDYILEHDEDFLQSVADVINKVNIDKYRTESFLPTIQQHNAYESVLNDGNSDISFVAPTSFGKSELIIRHIKKVNSPTLKAAIIVPTKSLLMQTYKYVKTQLTDKKILLHDQMYTGEESYIAVLTQERALRLLEKRSTYFDYLYVDEAHNLFEYSFEVEDSSFSDEVVEGDVLILMEAMKMETEVKAPKAGKVSSVNVNVSISFSRLAKQNVTFI